MKIGSLFSGVGGVEIGFERQGFETAWFVEYEPYAQSILRKRFPGTIIYDDVTKVDFKTVPQVQGLTGGFPCQDISNAGKREGIEGSRSSLWKYYFKAISEIRPKFAFIENVSALTQRGLDVVLCNLASIGYDAEWHCVPASAVGANHQRDRVFIIAYPNSNGNQSNNTTDIEKKEEVWNSNNKSIISEQCSDIDGSRDVSNSECIKRRTELKELGEQETRIESSRICEDVPDTMCTELQRSRQGRNKESHSCTEEKESLCKFTNWATEPKMGRVVDGLPNRAHRIRCLGNAVVPQVAEVFAAAIKEKCREIQEK